MFPAIPAVITYVNTVLNPPPNTATLAGFGPLAVLVNPGPFGTSALPTTLFAAACPALRTVIATVINAPVPTEAGCATNCTTCNCAAD
jgi:hypothetical protein